MLRNGPSGVQIPAAARVFSSPTHPGQLCEPPSLFFKAYWGYFHEIKRPGGEFSHLLPSSAELKNEWDCISTPPKCLLGEERENFTFNLRYHEECNICGALFQSLYPGSKMYNE
jgi:hypothetical protein